MVAHNYRTPKIQLQKMQRIISVIVIIEYVEVVYWKGPCVVRNGDRRTNKSIATSFFLVLHLIFFYDQVSNRKREETKSS